MTAAKVKAKPAKKVPAKKVAAPKPEKKPALVLVEKSKMLDEMETSEYHFAPGSIKGAMKVAGATSKDLWQVQPSALVVIPGLNPRVMNPGYKAWIRELADSMKSEGFYAHKPLAGYVNEEAQIVVRDGFTRLLAVELANSELPADQRIEALPVIVSQVGVTTEDITVAFVRNNTGRSLSIYETAVIVKRLAKFGHDSKEIARRLGFTEQHINNLLALIVAPAALREMVAQEVVSGSLAIDLISKHGAIKALERLKSGLVEAKAAGKTKVSAKDVKSDTFGKAVKKNAVELYEVLQALGDTNAFKDIKPDLYARIEAVLEDIEAQDDRPKEDGKGRRATDV